MSEPRSVEDWDAAAHGIMDIYRVDLLRAPGEMELGELSNWMRHWREEDRDLGWIRDRIRESQEYQNKHPGGPEPPPSPPPVVPPDLLPPMFGGAPEYGQGPGQAGGGAPIRVTDERDGEFINRGYSYFSQAWFTDPLVYVFAGHRDGSPRFFRVNLSSGEIERLGPLLGNRYHGEGEGLYWNRGWIYYCRGMELRRVSPFSDDDQRVFTIEGRFQFPCDLWQAHSDDNGETHSATVRKILPSGDTEKVGTAVYWNSDVKYFPARGELDESQIDASGQWVIIKETLPGISGVQNRVIELGTNETRTLTNAQGACGHSDVGPALLIGEWSPQQGEDIGQVVLWDLRQHLVPERRKRLLATWNAGHLSYRNGRCLRADDTNLSLLALDGSGEQILGPHGMTVDDPRRAYDFQCFANLDATARVAAFLSNKAGRMDLYVRVL